MPPKRSSLAVQIVGWAFVVFMAFGLFTYLLPETTQQRIWSAFDTLLVYFVIGGLVFFILVVVLYSVLWALFK